MRIVQFLKWMRRRDGGVVNTVSLLCPMHVRLGHQVALVSCQDDDLSDEQWIKIDMRQAAAHLGAFSWEDRALWERSLREGRPVSVRVDMIDPVARLRGRGPFDSERDTPSQWLPAGARRACENVLRGSDVLHIHGPWSTPNLQVGAMARHLRVPYVVSPHGMLDHWSMSQGSFKKKLHLAFFSGRLMNRARCVHFEGRVEMEQGRGYTTAPVTVGPPPPIDPRPFQGQVTPDLARERFPQLRTDDPVVLFIGRLNVKKAPDVLIRAAANWKREGLRVRVILAGQPQPPGYGDMLPALAKQLGVDDVCDLVGLVTGELKWSLLSAVDLVVLPTQQENFGIVLVEALAVGTPILTTKGVDIWPELHQSGGGIIIEGGAGTVQQVTDAVRDALRDRAALREMGQRAKAWAHEIEEPARLAEWYVRMLRGECNER